MYNPAMTKPSDTTTDIWISLSRGYQRILCAIEKSLKDASLPPLAWYDVLLELDRVGKAGLRPFELQEKLLLPQYSLSRLLGKIQQAGYLEQLPCDEDGRGQRVVITRPGKIKRQAMWQVYGPALEQEIAERLSKKDSKELSKLLRYIK